MEAKNSDSALVYYKGKKAGLLTKKDNLYEFEYDGLYLTDSSARPISLAMPLADKKFTSEVFFPFFDNLLPEGYLLKATVSKLKIDRNDKFRLLINVGADVSGAVTVLPV